MRYFVYGNPNCGKSLQFEKLFEQFKSRIYFGTLDPNLSKNKQIIKIHKQRRDEKWIEIEVSGHFENDINSISNSIEKFNVDGCFIDGITNWFIYYNYWEHDFEFVKQCTDKIINTVNLYRFINWVLIDISPIYLLKNNKKHFEICNYIHHKILDKIEFIEVTYIG